MRMRPPVDAVFYKLIKDFFDGYEPTGVDVTNPCQTAESQPYDKSYEIPLKHVSISRFNLLIVIPKAIIFCLICFL